MDVLTSFMAYAADFESTFLDDDWGRLRKHFTDDAIYEVLAEAFGCKLEGPDAIFAGMKKSLDGFDRRFSGREPAVTGAPVVDGPELRVEWTVTYSKEGFKPFVLEGRSVARMRDGKIAYLADIYEPAAEQAFAAWQRESGMAINASYT